MPSDALFFACELLHVSTERYEVLDSGVTIKSFQNRSQNAENEQKGPLFPFAPGVPGAVKATLQNSVRTEKSVGTMEGALCSLKQRGPLSGCSLMAELLRLSCFDPSFIWGSHATRGRRTSASASTASNRGMQALTARIFDPG